MHVPKDETLQIVVSVVGMATGILGTVLGVLNHLHQRDAKRPRLRVRPKVLTLVDRQTHTVQKDICLMEVSNIGQVPVLGSHVGFLGKRKGPYHSVLAPESINGTNWMIDFKPGQVALLRMRIDDLASVDNWGRAFACTLVDDRFVCTRRDMKKFRKELKEVWGGARPLQMTPTK